MDYKVDASSVTFHVDVPPIPKGGVTHTQPPPWRRWLRPLAYEAMKKGSHELIERGFEKAPEFIEKAWSNFFPATVKRKLD